MSGVKEAEAALRRAVAAGEFAAIAPLIETYVAETEAEARKLDPAEPAFAELEREGRELLRWAREAALAERAHAAARLRESRTARKYQLEAGESHINNTLA